MHAITLTDFGGPEQMKWTEVPTPEPGHGQVRIKTVAVGMNRADTLQRRGYYPPPPGESEIMGLEVSGYVDAIGEGSRWQPGDAVVALLAGGGYAEYVVVPDGQCAPVPEGMDIVSAAGVIEVAATVHSNMAKANLASGETLLVHGGAGGIGTFAIQYAKALGARVIATASAAKLDHVRSLGADVAIDYATDWPTAVAEATDGRGVDVILDIIGAKYLHDNVNSLALDGRLVVIGLQKGTKGELNLNTLLNKRAQVMAMSLRGRDTEGKSRIVQETATTVWPMYADGRIKLAPETRFNLRDAAKAHEYLESGELIGKIILTVDE